MKALIESEALKAKPSKRCIAENTRSVKALEELSNDSDWFVRSNVAYNPNCPVEILEKLSNDSDYSVRCNVAGNTSCSLETLKKLSKDYNWHVRKNAIANLKRIRGFKS